jgi:hypothetical protein
LAWSGMAFFVACKITSDWCSPTTITLGLEYAGASRHVRARACVQ